MIEDALRELYPPVDDYHPQPDVKLSDDYSPMSLWDGVLMRALEGNHLFIIGKALFKITKATLFIALPQHFF